MEGFAEAIQNQGDDVDKYVRAVVAIYWCVISNHDDADAILAWGNFESGCKMYRRL